MSTPFCSLRFLFSFCVAAVAVTAGVASTRADILELTNGDHYRGKVISMNESNVEFLSEIQGKVKLPRSKVAQITFYEVAKKVVVAPGTVAATTASGMAAVATPAPLVLSGSPVAAPVAAQPATGTGGSVVQEMQLQGIDPKIVAQIQEQIFSKASPEASKKFEDMMGSLMTGAMSVQDVQKMAQNSINQIKEAKKDLNGDAGEMLDGYLDILQKFLNEANAENNKTVPIGTNAAAGGGFSATTRAR